MNPIQFHATHQTEQQFVDNLTRAAAALKTGQIAIVKGNQIEFRKVTFLSWLIKKLGFKGYRSSDVQDFFRAYVLENREHLSNVLRDNKFPQLCSKHKRVEFISRETAEAIGLNYVRLMNRDSEPELDAQIQTQTNEVTQELNALKQACGEAEETLKQLNAENEKIQQTITNPDLTLVAEKQQHDAAMQHVQQRVDAANDQFGVIKLRVRNLLSPLLTQVEQREYEASLHYPQIDGAPGADYLKGLRRDDESADLIFTASDGTEIPAHSAFLAAHLQFFQPLRTEVAQYVADGKTKGPLPATFNAKGQRLVKLQCDGTGEDGTPQLVEWRLSPAVIHAFLDMHDGVASTQQLSFAERVELCEFAHHVGDQILFLDTAKKLLREINRTNRDEIMPLLYPLILKLKYRNDLYTDLQRFFMHALIGSPNSVEAWGEFLRSQINFEAPSNPFLVSCWLQYCRTCDVDNTKYGTQVVTYLQSVFKSTDPTVPDDLKGFIALQLALCCRDGKGGVQQSPQAWINYLELSARLGHPDAQYSLALHYLDTPPSECSDQQDTSHLKKILRLVGDAAERGHPNAQGFFIHDSRHSNSKNFKQLVLHAKAAVEIRQLRWAETARQGSAFAEFAFLYYQSELLSRPIDISCCQRAAERGSATACYYMAKLCTDPSKAMPWLMRAAELGDARAQFEWARFLLGETTATEERDRITGQLGIPSGAMEALEWFKRASEDETVRLDAESYITNILLPDMGGDLPAPRALEEASNES